MHRPARVDNRDRVVVPARYKSLDDFAALMDHGHRIWIDMRLKIDAREFASAAHVFDDAETVGEPDRAEIAVGVTLGLIAKIVRDEERVAVRADRDPAGIDRRTIAVVTR